MVLPDVEGTKSYCVVLTSMGVGSVTMDSLKYFR